MDGPGDAPDGRKPGFVAGARLTLFGHEDTPATVRLMPRSRAWRRRKAMRIAAVGLAVTPAVALVPPHAPWAIGALATAGILARRRWTEHFTLVEMTGACPRCGSDLRISWVRLRTPHPVPCETCNHEPTIVVDAGALKAHRQEVA